MAVRCRDHGRFLSMMSLSLRKHRGMDFTSTTVEEDGFEAETEKQLSPSQWSRRLPPDEVLPKHIQIITEGSKIAVETISKHELGVRYGPSDKQICDIFYPESGNTDAPILVFIHGGLWYSMAPSMYRTVALGFTGEGIQTVLAGYDLAPNATIAQMELEMRTLSQFILKRAAQTNSSVWFCGHSAGAQLVATLLYYEEAVENPLFKGVILISGLYDLTPFLKTSYNDILKLDRKTAMEASPIYRGQPAATNLKILIVVAEYDSPTYQHQSKDYYELLKCGSNKLEFIGIKNVDHFNIIENLSCPEFELTTKINTLIKTGELN